MPIMEASSRLGFALPFSSCSNLLCSDVVNITFPDGKRFDSSNQVLCKNLNVAKLVAVEFFSQLRTQCLEEKEQYEEQGRAVPRDKRNRWALYTGQNAEWRHVVQALQFIRDHPECRVRLLSDAYLRALAILQHLISQDTLELRSPEDRRMHSDTFEGRLTTNGVNSQLIKDAHRSEWSVGGRTFIMSESPMYNDDRRLAIVDFQQSLIECLEQFLMDFCNRWKLSRQKSVHLMQALTTQMSQAGLANLDRCSQASNVYVGGQGLDQRIAYNLSTMQAGVRGEVLQLSIYCMKHGFSAYHTPQSLTRTADNEFGPIPCSPASYLYRYATLCFFPTLGENGELEIESVVVDLLDELYIKPVEPL